MARPKLYAVINRRGKIDRIYTFTNLRMARKKRNDMLTKLGWPPSGRDTEWSLIKLYRLIPLNS